MQPWTKPSNQYYSLIYDVPICRTLLRHLHSHGISVFTNAISMLERTAKVTGRWGMSLLVLGFHLEGPNHAIPWVIQNDWLQSERPQREEPVPGDRRNRTCAVQLAL